MSAPISIHSDTATEYGGSTRFTDGPEGGAPPTDAESTKGDDE